MFLQHFVTSIVAISLILPISFNEIPVQAATTSFKPVTSIEEIVSRFDEMAELFDGYRWGNLDSSKIKTMDQLKQAVQAGYTNMGNGYTMDQRRAALGLQKVDGHATINSNKFGGIECHGFAKFMCYVLFRLSSNRNRSSFKIFRGDYLWENNYSNYRFCWLLFYLRF